MFPSGKNRSSFTLIELLVVLALVAILSVVVVMTLNPAELIKQARDSNRLSDLSTINTALNLFSADVTGGFMGTSTVLYVSIPDTSPTCANLGLPLLSTSSYTYNCVTRANLRNTDGTGWIPVNLQRISSNSPISQLPIDPINTTTTLNYYTYVSGGSWKLSVISLESQKYIAEGIKDGGAAQSSYEIGNNLTLGQTVFPNGWIKVPGDSRFGTSDFWVMDHEAKCSDSNGNLLTSPTEGAAQNYHNNYDGSSGCIFSNNKYIASASDGYPIAKISQISAITYCQSIGSHLITNNEWQTVVWNIQNVASNWSSGVVGSGTVNRGNSLAAGAMTGTNTLTGITKRTHTLSNGNVIWDMAGNLYEILSDTVLGDNKPSGNISAWVDWTDVSNFVSFTRQGVGPLIDTWNSSNGIGKYYQGAIGGSTYVFMRGGNWNDSANAGLESLVLTNGTASTGSSGGFRCAR